jgi:FixJ family two-component response regulator
MARGTVYLIEDDDAVRKALRRLMTAAGYDVRTFSDAASYMTSPTPAVPGCLVLDVRMPLVSGFELQSATVGTTHDLPIIFITGHGGEDVRAQAVSAGAVELLFKPIDEDRLIAAIETALAHSPARQRTRG